MRKTIWIIVLSLILIGLGLLYYKFYFVLGYGVKSGELNYLVKKGYIFKTYEGKLIQSGLRSKAPNTVQSYDFEFSVVKESIADTLMSNSGKVFDLHYKEYLGALPWRGYTKFIVDSIISMKEPIGLR
ncbi:MAG: hypothetical protein C5B52_06860 [Bacteroidetes bacterium]|nr:MAG: hypothetical protein C5B52_06860 [Bacteroidota bacterium]